MYAVVMFLYTVTYGRVMASVTSTQDFFVSNGQSKKFDLIQKSHVSVAFVSCAKALQVKRSKKGYGDENDSSPGPLVPLSQLGLGHKKKVALETHDLIS